MIFQEPMTALDPVYTIGQQIGETSCATRAARARPAARALELLQLVQGALARAAARKPIRTNCPGGLRQRAMIAMALSCNPSLLLADEPTTALDATVQIQVLILLRRLQRELGMGVIFVTHDLGVAAQIADKVAVMYAGRIVEYGNVRDVLCGRATPTRGHARLDRAWRPVARRRYRRNSRQPARHAAAAVGCSFAPRCRYADQACIASVPPPAAIAPGRQTCCFKAGHLTRAEPQSEIA